MLIEDMRIAGTAIVVAVRRPSASAITVLVHAHDLIDGLADRRQVQTDDQCHADYRYLEEPREYREKHRRRNRTDGSATAWNGTRLGLRLQLTMCFYLLAALLHQCDGDDNAFAQHQNDQQNHNQNHCGRDATVQPELLVFVPRLEQFADIRYYGGFGRRMLTQLVEPPEAIECHCKRETIEAIANFH